MTTTLDENRCTDGHFLVVVKFLMDENCIDGNYMRQMSAVATYENFWIKKSR